MDDDSTFVRVARLAARGLGVPGAELMIGGTSATWGDQRPDATLTAAVAAAGEPLVRDGFAGVRVGRYGTLCVTAAAARSWSDDDLGLLSDLAAAVVDELDQRRVRHDLLRSIAMLDSVLWTAPVALAFFDTELRYTHVNDALAEINGVSAADHLGKTVPEVLPDQSPQVQRDLERVLRTGEASVGTEVAGETPAQPGVLRHWLVSYYPVRTQEGEVFGVGAVVLEITARKQAEQERAVLLAASQRATARLAALQSITAQLSGVATLDGIADVLAGSAMELLGLRASALVLNDADDRLRVVRTTGLAHAPDGLLVDERDPLALALRARRVAVHSGPGPTSAVLPAGVSSVAFVPLVVGGHGVGALALAWPVDAPAPEDADRLLAALGDQLAQAVERARLLQAEHAARARLAFLAEASRVLSASLDADETMRDLARLAVAEVADACVVSVASERGLRLVAAAHTDPAREQQLWQQGPPSAVPDEAMTAEETTDLGLRWVMAAPLRTHGDVLGVLALYQGPSGRRFARAELTWMEDLAARAAAALENARLYRDRAHVARTLQRSLLPPTAPAIPGLEVAARYHPVSEGSKVGGDFYDVFPLGTEAWGVVMGDVSGKGVAAASLTALSRYTVRAAALHLDSPSDVLETLNRAILDGNFDERFCTIVYLSVREDEGRARIRLAIGGHPPPLLIGADGSVSPVGVEGTAVGLISEPGIVDTDLILEPGETLVLYTDGVLDARSADGVWGDELLESVLADTADRDPGELADALADAVLDLAAGSPRDDVAILILRVPAEQRIGKGLAELLPPEPVAAVHARRILRQWLGSSPRDDEILLVATELISNAARVARSSIALRTWRTPSAVMVEVADDGEGFAPHTGAGITPPAEAESGRGLFLVSALADDVQITTTSSGTAVRCRLELNSL